MENKRMITIILAALIVMGGIVASTYKVSDSLIEIKGTNFITVSGSARKQITSDLMVWTGSFGTQSNNLPAAYTQLNADQKKVKDFLVSKGIPEAEMIFSAISTNPIYAIAPNGMYTSNIEGYRLEMRVEISSNELDKLTKVSREITELLNVGVEFQSWQPQYFYTKIADMKVSMLAEATKDAKARAEQIAINTGSEIGSLRSAKMGVMQITPVNSTDVSDYGINDTSSIEKAITAIVTATFEIK